MHRHCRQHRRCRYRGSRCCRRETHHRCPQPRPGRNQLFRLRRWEMHRRCRQHRRCRNPRFHWHLQGRRRRCPQPRPDRNLSIRLHQMETRRRYRVPHPRQCLEGCQGCHLRPNQRTFHSTRMRLCLRSKSNTPPVRLREHQQEPPPLCMRARRRQSN